MSGSVQIEDALQARASEASRRATEALLSHRNHDGFWHGEWTAGTSLEARLILCELWIHPPVNGSWAPPNRRIIDRAAESILSRQGKDGGFPAYPDGPMDLDASIEAYAALKLAGIDPDEPRLAAARSRVVELGGLHGAGGLVKAHLSLFGLYPAAGAPAVPVEIMFQPRAFIDRMPSWARAIVVPLAILQALHPECPLPSGFTLDELISPDLRRSTARPGRLRSRRPISNLGCRLMEGLGRLGLGTLRQAAIQRAEERLLPRIDAPGNFPALIYSIMALHSLGYDSNHPVRRRAEAELGELVVDEAGPLRVRPWLAPVSDTAAAALAIAGSGEEIRGELRQTVDWLLNKTVDGAWSSAVAGERSPAADETAMVVMALKKVGAGADAVAPAVDWLLGTQSRGGGWAAFGDGQDGAGFEALALDRSAAALASPCPDVTGRVLEALCESGLAGSEAARRRAVRYLIRAQEQDGGWRGRWGVNYIYGTCWVLRGLRAAGESDREVHVLRAAEWLRSIQNADGGWGESCGGYETGEFEPAPSTPSQTAWALLGLIAAGDLASDSVRRGLEHLLERQLADGSWNERLAVRVGIPGLPYLTGGVYRSAFPLMALSGYLQEHGRKGSVGL